MVEISVYAKNTGEGLNPDKRIQEEKDIALIETNSAVLESDEFDQEKIKEFIAASNRLGLMEETDPSKISKQDERIHFHIDGKYYAYNQDTYPEEMSIEEAKSLVKLEEKFHALEVQNRKLKGIDPDVELTDTEKEHLEELKKEILQLQEHEKNTASYMRQGEDFDQFTQSVAEIERKDEEESEKYRRKTLEERINDIRNAEGNQAVFGLMSTGVNLEDTAQPQYETLQKQLKKIQKNVPEYKLDDIKTKAIELVIQKEVANREGKDFPFVSYGEARGLLRSGNLTEQDLAYYLTDEDLKDFYKERYVKNPELFGINKDPKRLKESDALMSDYSNRARGNALENLKDVELEPQIPFGKVREFLLSDDPSISEISSFLEGRDFQDLGHTVYLEGNAAHFDIEGKPIDSEGKEVRDRFFEIAKERAEENKFLAIEEQTLREFNEGPLGSPTNKALAAYEKTISENKPRSWRERNTFFVLNAKVRARRQEKLEAYQKANYEKKKIEKFKESYLRERGAYTAKLWGFEKSIKEKLDGEDLLSGNLNQRTRRQIRKVASRLRMESIYLNEKVIKRLDGLTDCRELLSAFNEAGYESFDDFTEKYLIDEAGWELPETIGTNEQDKKYGTSLEGEKKAFISTMDEDYGAIRDVVRGYIEKEYYNQLRNAEITRARGLGISVEGGMINSIMAGGHATEINRRTEKYVKDLKEKFNSDHADGFLHFAANVGYLGKMIRKDLNNEIFGGREGKNINVTKVIELLDGQRINELQLHEGERRFELEMERFCSKENCRQRKEKWIRRISGNPLFKKDEYKGLKDALEEGTSRRSRTFQGAVGLKDTFLDLGGDISVSWNRKKRATYSIFHWFAPYSDGVRQKIDDTLENEQNRWAKSMYREQRREMFGIVTA